MRFHIFHTDNVQSDVINAHKKCCEKIEIETEYHSFTFPNDYSQVCSLHGDFMTFMMKEETDDVVCFLDLDCLPHNKKILEEAYAWVKENSSFVGNAQNVSHIQTVNRVYAAPSMIMIHKNAWKTLGSPSLRSFMQNGLYIDTAQILSLRADEIGFHYRIMYPIGCDGDPIYKLAGYGQYGHGTLYPATWHYFAIGTQLNEIKNIWNQRVNNILNDEKIIPINYSIYYGL